MQNYSILLLILLILTYISLVSLYLYLTWHFDYWRKRKIPGPIPKSLFGTFPSTVTGKRNFIYDLDEIYRNFKSQSKFVGVFMTRNPQIMILDPGLTKEVLTTNFKCFQDNESSKWMNREKEPISSRNPFVLPASDWKIKRAEIVPGLTLSKVKGMYPIIQEICKKLTKYLNAEVKVGKAPFDAKDFSLRYTGEVVADVVWGIEGGTFNSTTAHTECTFLRMSNSMIAQTFRAFTYFFVIGVFPIIRRFLSVRFFPEITDRYFLNLTHMACSMRNCMPRKRQDFLQHLIELQQKRNITDIEMVAHMLTFHFDGFETSATLISHCLLLLGRYPSAQQKLRQEIVEKLSENGGATDITFDELMKLPYLEQCVAETLRIFTPLPFMSKICTEPCTLENSDGIRLQAKTGDICLISLHSFHHDEDYFPQAETFLPERFADENGGTKKYKDMGVYLPFGDGPRICLGMKFGLAQAKAAIVAVIKNFEVSVNERTRTDNLQGSSGFITGLDGGIHLNLKEL